MNRIRNSEKEQSQWKKISMTFIDKISTYKDTGLQKLFETLEKKQIQEEKTGTGSITTYMARVIKPAKVLSQTKNISLDTFIRWLDI